MDRTSRARKSVQEGEVVREAYCYVRLTNYGDGIAYDIKPVVG